MNRQETIRAAVVAHNAFLDAWNQAEPGMRNENFWDESNLARQPDRYYLVEQLGEKTWDRENDTKTYEPKVEVRRLLRSREANAYGKGHDAFYKRYLATIGFSYADIELAAKDVDEFRNRMYNALELELNKHREVSGD